MGPNNVTMFHLLLVMRARMTQIQENIRDSTQIAGLFGLAKSNNLLQVAFAHFRPATRVIVLIKKLEIELIEVLRKNLSLKR